MSAIKSIFDLFGPLVIVVASTLLMVGGAVAIPASEGANTAYDTACAAVSAGAEDGQGPMSGIHPVASSALRRAGITGGISRGLLNEGDENSTSAGTHGHIIGSQYGGSFDVMMTGKSAEHIRKTLHDVRMQGFAAWYRPFQPRTATSKGWGPHVHGVYAGLPVPNAAMKQVKDFLGLPLPEHDITENTGPRDGFGGHRGTSFPLETLPTPEEIASVRSVYQGGSGCVGSSDGPQNGDAKAFFDWIGPLAAADDERTGVPGSITAAQAGLESGYGTDYKAKQGKALFGVECTSHATAGCIGKNGRFAAYLTYADSIADHSRVLKLNHYSAARRYLNTSDPNDARNFIKIVAPIYAPVGEGDNRNYIPEILSTIDRYKLHQYDR